MEFPILPWLVVVGVLAIVMRWRGDSARQIVGGALLGFVLSVLVWSAIWSIGIVASVVAVLLVGVWATLFGLLRWIGRRRVA